MKGKHIFAGWLFGGTLASGIWASAYFPKVYIIVPTVLLGLLTISYIIAWIMCDDL